MNQQPTFQRASVYIISDITIKVLWQPGKQVGVYIKSFSLLTKYMQETYKEKKCISLIVSEVESTKGTACHITMWLYPEMMGDHSGRACVNVFVMIVLGGLEEMVIYQQCALLHIDR